MSTIVPTPCDDKATLRLQALQRKEFKKWTDVHKNHLKPISELLLRPTPPTVCDYQEVCIRRRMPISTHLYYLMIAEYLPSETKAPFVKRLNSLFKK